MKNALSGECAETATERLIVVLITQSCEELHTHSLSKSGQDSYQSEKTISYLTIATFFFISNFNSMNVIMSFTTSFSNATVKCTLFILQYRFT
jgi:hypothetical protein